MCARMRLSEVRDIGEPSPLLYPEELSRSTQTGYSHFGPHTGVFFPVRHGCGGRAGSFQAYSRHMIFSFALKALWGVVGLAGALVVVAILTAIDFATSGDDNARSATFGFLLLAALLGIPGGIALIRARANSRLRKLQDLVVGYVRSRDAIRPQELARKTDLNEMEAEAMLIGLIEAKEISLVFHRSRDEYLHPSRIAEAHHCFDRCNSCGATLRAQVVFSDETVYCEYCNTPLKRPSASKPPS